MRSHVIQAHLFFQLPQVGGQSLAFLKSKKKLDALTNISDWRLHDFRRTIATNLEEIDVDRFTVKCVLNHSDASITGVYDRSTHTKRKLRALENWEQPLFGQMNIVHLAMAKG